MKNLIIVVLVAVVAVLGVVTAIAATRTIEVTANVDVRVWRAVSDGSLFLSTRPEGGSWTTHETALNMSELSRSGRFRQSSFVRVSVPVEVTIDSPVVTEPTEDPTRDGVGPDWPGVDATTSRFTWLYAGPGESYAVAERLTEPTTLRVLGRDISGIWVKVARGGGLWLKWLNFSPIPDTEEWPVVDRMLFGEGQRCLETTGCGLGYFDVPSGVLLRVGVDIAPGKWNSDIEGIAEDSCYAVRLSDAVTSHPNYIEDRDWVRWLSDLTRIPQPSGSYARHESVLEFYSTSYVYGPRSVSIDIEPEDYAVVIDYDCMKE